MADEHQLRTWGARTCDLTRQCARRTGGAQCWPPVPVGGGLLAVAVVTIVDETVLHLIVHWHHF